MLSTYGHGPGPPQMGPGPPHAIRIPADESGTSTCLSGPPVSSRLSQLLGRGPEPPRVTQTRARAQTYRWKLPHSPTLSVNG